MCGNGGDFPLVLPCAPGEQGQPKNFVQSPSVIHVFEDDEADIAVLSSLSFPLP